MVAVFSFCCMKVCVLTDSTLMKLSHNHTTASKTYVISHTHTHPPQQNQMQSIIQNLNPTAQICTFNIPMSHVISVFVAGFLNTFTCLHFHICLTTWTSFSGHCHMNTKLPILNTTVTCVYKTCLSLISSRTQEHNILLLEK